jgi:hypothetical protein
MMTTSPSQLQHNKKLSKPFEQNRHVLKNFNDEFNWHLENKITTSTINLPSFSETVNKTSNPQNQNLGNLFIEHNNQIFLIAARKHQSAKNIYFEVIQNNNEDNKKWICTMLKPETIEETEETEIFWRHTMVFVLRHMSFPAEVADDQYKTMLVDASISYLHLHKSTYQGNRNPTNLQAGMINYIATEMVRKLLSTKTKQIIDIPTVSSKETPYKIYVFLVCHTKMQ